MSLRLGAWLLVLVVAGAPAALTACEIVCAAHDSHSEAAAHSCHRTQPSDGPLIDVGVQVCGHDEELPDAAPAQVNPPTLLAVAVATSSILPMPAASLDGMHVVVSWPLGHLKRPTPLRI
jgi:hypothetical protein